MFPLPAARQVVGRYGKDKTRAGGERSIDQPPYPISSGIAYSHGPFVRPALSQRKEPTVPEPLLTSQVSQEIFTEEVLMKRIIVSCALIAASISTAYAATTLSAAPADSSTVTNYYKQSVYDPKQNKIGDVDDVLVDKSGKITGLVVGVGGFLGAGEKDVIVPFSAVKSTKKDDKWYLTLDESKDSLKNSAGFKYNKTSTTWESDKSK